MDSGYELRVDKQSSAISPFILLSAPLLKSLTMKRGGARCIAHAETLVSLAGRFTRTESSRNLLSYRVPCIIHGGNYQVFTTGKNRWTAHDTIHPYTSLNQPCPHILENSGFCQFSQLEIFTYVNFTYIAVHVDLCHIRLNPHHQEYLLRLNWDSENCYFYTLHLLWGYYSGDESATGNGVSLSLSPPPFNLISSDYIQRGYKMALSNIPFPKTEYVYACGVEDGRYMDSVQ